MAVTDSNLPPMPANALPDQATTRDWAKLPVQRARRDRVELTGDGGLLTASHHVLQTGSKAEMTEHLGYQRNAANGSASGNSRNGE